MAYQTDMYNALGNLVEVLAVTLPNYLPKTKVSRKIVHTQPGHMGNKLIEQPLPEIKYPITFIEFE